jgi:hypothetical protein
MSQPNSNNYLLLAIVAIVAVVALVFLMQPKETPGTKLENAVEEMADGIDDAADELKPNRTAGEKLGDAVEDAGDSIKDATN